MKIAEVRVDPSLLPKKDKDWRFALAASGESQGWTVSIITEDGSVGYGYASAMAHYGAPLESVKANLDSFAKILVGKNSRNIAGILAELDRSVVGNNQAKSGIDCALHDLLARRLGIPLCDLFGGPAVTEFPSLRILPIKTPEKMAANARALWNKGVRHFKIKVHGNVEEDVACVAAIREELGRDAHLTIDANQSYSVKNAIRAISLMAVHNIELAEQPVAASDLRGLKMVTDAVAVPVEADEAAYSLDQVAIIVRERAADAVSLKLSKLGGLRNTLSAAKICEANGIRYRMGAHSGPMLLAAHAVHLAAALPGIWYASELTEFDGLAADNWTGLEIRDGTLLLPTTPGCGVNPKPEAKLPTRNSANAR
jgi:L-alanine-DL-glutamate epimerase-like enolase superfamily enzyme